MNGLRNHQKPEEIPQCQYFVQRKKRLCRMTVRPGKRYCGEHEPEPRNEAGEPDVRVPCPLDPKHTCYVSKLEKHLQICNARQVEQPEHIVPNINSPGNITNVPRKPLNQIPEKDLLKLIDKVNSLYEKLLEGQITPIPQQEIHSVVKAEFNEADRTESSRRHLRQASSLLRLMEDEGLVQDNTCYVELGAGKGQLSYYACTAWCAPPSRSVTLLVDRAALRHKRDNKLTGGVARLRADLAHLSLGAVAAAAGSERVVGFAKHLCGVAMDFALRCLTAAGVLHKTRGIMLATCCHHRIERAAYVATRHTQDLGIDAEELNIMLGIVSWATCGDGRSREKRNAENTDTIQQSGEIECASKNDAISETGSKDHIVKNTASLTQEYRESVGRRAKAILDWGRVLYLRDKGFDARLCQYVPASVSLENVCIVATKVS